MLIFRFSKMNEFSTARFISPRFYFLRDTISQDYYILWGFNYQHFLAETIYSKNSLRIAKKLEFLSEFLKKSDWGNQMVVKLIQNSFIFFLKNSVAVCVSNKLPTGHELPAFFSRDHLLQEFFKDCEKIIFLSEFLMNSDWRDQMVVQLIQNSFIFFLKNSVAVCISNKLPKGKVIITLENKHPLIYQPLKDKLSHE